MGKGKKRATERRIAELRELAKSAGFRLVEFSAIHFRIFGAVAVDYWPTTGRMWITGSATKAAIVEPHEAIHAAQQEAQVIDGESAASHMKSIRAESDATEKPPWEE